jgi:hypothetical protein
MWMSAMNSAYHAAILAERGSEKRGFWFLASGSFQAL